MGLAGEAPKRVRGRDSSRGGWLAASKRQSCDVATPLAWLSYASHLEHSSLINQFLHIKLPHDVYQVSMF